MTAWDSFVFIRSWQSGEKAGDTGCKITFAVMIMCWYFAMFILLPADGVLVTSI